MADIQSTHTVSHESPRTPIEFRVSDLPKKLKTRLYLYLYMNAISINVFPQGITKIKTFNSEKS